MVFKIFVAASFLLIAESVIAQQSDTLLLKKDYLEQIVVTGTRTRRALKDVPVITRLITADEIKKESPGSLANLLETELPGIEFTRTEGVSNSITFQGMGANYLLILIDGERMAGETQRSNPDFNRIDIDNVERIEIVKGAMSTLYGSGAVAGVINIITKEASKPFEAGIEGLYNGEGEQRAGINIGAKTNNGFSTYTSA
ncbi:MAG: TonB-dependent receptor plug domain-containing protein, partial [Bacteroidales bacterium]